MDHNIARENLSKSGAMRVSAIRALFLKRSNDYLSMNTLNKNDVKSRNAGAGFECTRGAQACSLEIRSHFLYIYTAYLIETKGLEMTSKDL
jgi:hypothetical protein